LTAPPEGSPKPQHHRWFIVLFVFFATVLNYMDRQTISILAPLIQKDFHLDNAQLGALFSAFYVSYGVTVALVGELIDRLSIRIAFAVAVAWWSLATSLTGLARSFGQLFGFRLALGVGEAANWPLTARLVSMYMAPKERTLANSLYMGGGSLGLVIIGPLLVWLSLWQGWRAGFVVVGALSMLWLIAWLSWFKPRNIDSLERHDLAAKTRTAGSWRGIIRLPRFWGLVISSFCGNACLYFLMNWLPQFLVQDRGIRFSMKLGTVIIIPFLGLDLGYLISGFGVLALGRRGWKVLSARRFFLVFSATLMSTSMAATPFVGANALTLALLFAGALGMAGWNSNYLCFVEELSPRKAAAVAGVIGSAGAFAGALTLWIIGLISKAAGNFTPVFLLVAGLIWIATAGIMLTREPYRAESAEVGADAP
jgi:ACS family hexuronate transporter-like MFS transporter